MKVMPCFVCQQQKDDVKNYRDKLDVEVPLILAYPKIRQLNAKDPLFVCEQCVDEVKEQNPSTAEVRKSRSPQSSLEAMDDTNVSVCSDETIPEFEIPFDAIDDLFPDSLRRNMVRNIIKEPMPKAVRKRKFEEILQSEEVQERMHELQQLSEHQKYDIKRRATEDIDSKGKMACESVAVNGYLSTGFTIKINGKNFNVHKEIVKLFSPVLTTIIYQSSKANEISLEDIEEEAFEAILYYMYHKILPGNMNIIDVFSACGKLQIDCLSNILADKLKDNIKPENADKVLGTCGSYLNDELKVLALDKFKEKLNQELNSSIQSITLDRVAMKPEKLDAIMKIKEELDKIIAAE